MDRDVIGEHQAIFQDGADGTHIRADIGHDGLAIFDDRRIVSMLIGASRRRLTNAGDQDPGKKAMRE